MAVELTVNNVFPFELTTATIIAYDETVVDLNPQAIFQEVGFTYPQFGFVGYLWQFYFELRLPTAFNTVPSLEMDGVTGEIYNRSFFYTIIRGEKVTEVVNPLGYNHHSKTYNGIAYDLMETTECKHIERGGGLEPIPVIPYPERAWQGHRGLLYMDVNMYISVEMTINWDFVRNTGNTAKYYIMW